MSIALTIPDVELYDDLTGRAADLRLQPYTSANATSGSAISATFSEIGGGHYRFSGNVPDDTSEVAIYLLAVGGGSTELHLGRKTLAALLSDARITTALPNAAPGASGGLARLSDVNQLSAPFAVFGVRVHLSGQESSAYLRLIKGDDKSVAVFFEDESSRAVPIPSGATAALLDVAGSAVGTATITDSKTSVGYLLVRLQVPSSGNLPATLRITFGGGAGGAYKHDIPVRCNA